MAIESKALIAEINELLGKDLDIPGRGIGVTLVRDRASWLTKLQRVTTLDDMRQLFQGSTIREPKVPLRLWEHKDSVVACLERAGVKPFGTPPTQVEER